jgi:hypothetical protein
MDERDELLLRIGKLYVERERAIEVAQRAQARAEEAETQLKGLEEVVSRKVAESGIER